MTPQSKAPAVLDDPITAAIEALDAPRRRQAETAAQSEQAASAKAREPVRGLILAVLAEARAAGAPAEQQLARPLASGQEDRDGHLELEDRTRMDGVLASLTTTVQRARRVVAQLEGLATELDGAGSERLVAIETEVRERLIPQIAPIRARGAAVGAECAEVAAALRASVAVLETHIAWLTPAEDA